LFVSPSTDIIDMHEYLIDNIFVVFGGGVFQQTVGIPMGTKCAPILADLFLYSYEADFIQRFIKKNEIVSENFLVESECVFFTK
jgi:hypothetical protein